MSFTEYLSICGIIWAALSGTEKYLSQSTLISIYDWLKQSSKKYDANTFLNIFLSIMKSTLLIKRRYRITQLPNFFASALITLIFILFLGVITFSNYFDLIEYAIKKTEEEYPEFRKWKNVTRNVYYLVGATWTITGVFVAILVDYLSLSSTYIFIRKYIIAKRKISKIIIVISELTIKVLLSFLCYFITATIANYLFQSISNGVAHLYPPKSFLEHIDEFLLIFRTTHINIHLPTWTTFSYSTFLPIFWLLLFAIFMGMGKVFSGWKWYSNILDKRFKFKEKPLSVLAWSSILFVSILYAIYRFTIILF